MAPEQLTRNGYATCMQVKQYVAEVKGPWCWFQVFETGDPKYYLFQQLDPNRCATELQFPVRKSELVPAVRSALAHGVGHAR
jgi:hypothetical protein